MKKTAPMPLTYVQIDLKSIEHNFLEIKRLVKRNQFLLPTRRSSSKSKIPIKVLCVIKADAYGHGVKEVSQTLKKCGVDYFAVSDVCEGIKLRQNGIKIPILLLESSLPEYAKSIIDFNLTPTVCNDQMAQALEKYASLRHQRMMIHVKVDTGMGRLGVWHKDAFAFIKNLMNLRHLTIEGIYTHFPSADTDIAFTQGQIQWLYELVIKLDQEGIVIPLVHASNSMGLMGYKTKVFNLMRPGLMIYGLYPNEQIKKQVVLKPAMSVHSRIIFLKTISKGQSISYGRTFIASKVMIVATIPIGYSDGYLRAESNHSTVLIGGKHCRVLGRVTMDQIVVDVSLVKNPKLGDAVVILGRQGKKEITADQLALSADTINYEIVCNLGNRLLRKYS